MDHLYRIRVEQEFFGRVQQLYLPGYDVKAIDLLVCDDVVLPPLVNVLADFLCLYRELFGLFPTFYT